jgi:hypothetical protein
MSVLHKTQPPPFRADTAVRVAPLDQRVLNELAAVTKIAEDFPEFAKIETRNERKEFLGVKIRELRRDVGTHDRKRKHIYKRLAELDRMKDAYNSIISWIDAGVVLERPDGPAFRDLRRAISQDENLWYYDEKSGAPSESAALEKEVFRHAEVFVVEHDWASAFASSDMQGAPFKLPYDVCAFEFRLSGRPVIALATHLETKVFFSLAFGGPDGWLLPDYSIEVSDPPPLVGRPMADIYARVGDQIRAICIALEAEVARSDVQREPYAGTGKNTFSAARSYHVVSLARRAARPLAAPGNATGRRVRLHFRRGHWRHFETHKTWIKWMLVGDPELGFIDKHYRL